MGLGGFLAAKVDAEHYESELKREENEIVEAPDREADEIVELFKNYGVSAGEAVPVVAALRRDRFAPSEVLFDVLHKAILSTIQRRAYLFVKPHSMLEQA